MSLHSRITSALGADVLSLSPLQGGCIAEVHRAEMADGSRAVIKAAGAHGEGSLDLEAWMLDYLAEKSRLPVPRVLHSEPDLLIMEYIEGASRFGPAAERCAAELIADLHTISAPTFGLERDTLIGPLHQPNPQSSSWIEFFRDHRLLHMAQVARDHGALPPRIFGRVRTLADRIASFIDEPESPALLHGDLWTTNILADGDRITGFIDPAIYYGHPEIELAFSTLFGTFSPTGPFFERYHQLRPIRPGFFGPRGRRDIYNLYPLLVHVRLFGAGYVPQVEGILSRAGV